MAVIWIPTMLRSYTSDTTKITTSGETLGEAIKELNSIFPGISNKILNEKGDSFIPSIAISIDGETNHLGLIERLKETSEVHIIPAIGGGSENHKG